MVCQGEVFKTSCATPGGDTSARLVPGGWSRIAREPVSARVLLYTEDSRSSSAGKTTTYCGFTFIISFFKRATWKI